MKQTIQKCSSTLTRMLLILMLLLTGSASAWGGNIEINTTNSGVTGSYADKTFDVNDVTFGFTQWMKNNNIQAKKSTTNSCYNVDAIPGTIKKITIVQTGTARAIKIYGGTSSKPTTEITAPSTAATMVFDFTGKNYTYFSMTTPGNAVYINTITIEYESSGGGGGNNNDDPVLYTVTLGDDSSELTQETEGGNVSLPSRTGNSTYTFSGWSETNVNTETTTKPAIIQVGNYTPTSNITLYPVYKRTEGQEGYILSESVSGTIYYMKHDCSATTAKGEAENFIWNTGTGLLTYSANSNTYYITHQTSGSTNLVNNTTVPASGKEWTITDNTTNNTVKFNSKAQNTRYLGTTGSGFKAYAASHTLNYEPAGTTYYISSIPAEKSLVSVTVSGTPTKTTYQAGENFDPAGLTVTGTYDDDSHETITEGITWSTPAALTAGQTSVTITATVNGVTSAEYTVNGLTVNAPVTLTSISVSGTPAEFWKGDTFNHNGMTVTATWSDDSQTDVTSEAEFSTPDMSTPGVQTVTVTYQGKTDTYNIEVKTIANTQATAYTTTEAIALINAGKDLSTEVYVKGTISKIVTAWSDQYNNITYNISDDGETTSEQFQLFRCVTNNGAVGDDVIARGTLTKYSTTYELSAGNTIVSITKATTLSIADIEATVEDGTVEPTITTNIVGNYSISYTSNNDDVVQVDGTTLRVAGETGTATITATISAAGYKDAQTTFVVTVTSAATLESITISGVLTTSTYTVGDDFDFSGLTATGNYSDASNADLTSAVEWSIEPATLSAGMTSVTVKATFDDVTGSKDYSITVNKKTASITIADIELGIDESIDIEATTTPADAALSYTITNGSDKITLEGSHITAVAEGSATVKASYAGNETYAACEKSFTVTVNNTKTASIKSFSATSGDINSDISYEAFKGNAATAPAVNTNNLRLYQNGGYVTISGIKGVKIQSVKLTTGSSYNSTTVGYCVDDEDAPTEGETVANNTEYTISDLDNQNVSIYCLGTDKNTRLDIAALEVRYTKEEVTLSSIAVSGEYTTEFIQNTTFNHDGAIVTAIFSDGDEQDVTASATFSTPDMTTTGEKTVNISYTYEGDTKATSYNINVTAETVTSIALSGTYQTIFREGETFTHEGVVVTATYNSGRNAVVTNEATFSTPDMSQVGNQAITVEFGGQQTSYTIIVLSANNLFYESFDKNNGTGGNDNQWSGSIANNAISTDNDGWTFASANGAKECAKFGTGNAKGSAQTPEISFSGAAEITFKAAAWNGNNEGTKLNLSATSGTLSQDSVTLSKGAWTDYTVYITGVETETQIKFEAANVSNNRFFLDEICVNQITASESVSISQYGLATCVTSSPLIFAGSGVTAYKLVVDPVRGKVILSSVAQVPAGTPILVSGEEGTHAVPVIASAEAVSTALQCSDGTATSTNDMIIYYLGVVNGSATFRPLAKGKTLTAGKCYFVLPSSAPSLRVEFEDEEEGNASAISSIPVENLGEATYDLLGQKNNGVKGLMIRNGKVIFIK